LGLPKLDASEYGILFGILSLTGIFFYGILRRSKPYEVDVSSHTKSEEVVEEMQGQKNMEAVATTLFMRTDETDKSIEDPEVLLDSEVTHSAEQAMPKNVQALFSSIDLNLGPSSVSPVKPDQISVDSNQSENLIESSAILSKVLLNSDEQKVRLNLARSYIKIKDFETARILLSDLIEQGANADQDVISQASSLLLEIS
jgi:FimV-like protein